jgi:hypothetical protein
MTSPLTPNQHVAVTSYALANGENLKDRLAADWRDGRSEGELQRLRNSHGPAWLAIYSLADWPKRMFARWKQRNAACSSTPTARTPND